LFAYRWFSQKRRIEYRQQASATIIQNQTFGQTEAHVSPTKECDFDNPTYGVGVPLNNKLQNHDGHPQDTALSAKHNTPRGNEYQEMNQNPMTYETVAADSHFDTPKGNVFYHSKDTDVWSKEPNGKTADHMYEELPNVV
jgi:hypothetical protein